MSVKRYQMQESAYGPFVQYKDFFELEAKYNALVEAARPVVEDWTKNRGTALDTSTDKEVGFVIATFEQLDALAALVGEE